MGWLCFFLLISRMLIGIFLLNMTIILYGLVPQVLWIEGLPFGLATAPRAFTFLTKPILFLSIARVFMLFGWYPGPYLACWWEGLHLLVLCIGSSWTAYKFFQVWALSYIVLFFFRAVLEYSGHVCLLTIWQTHWDPAMGSCYVTEGNHFCPSSYVLSTQKHLLCQWICPTFPVVPCPSEWYVYHSFAYFLLSFYLLFQCCISFIDCLNCSRFQSPCSFLFLMWLLLLMLCPIIEPFIFRVLGFPSLVVAPDLVLCKRCLLPCKDSRLLHSCCIQWPFGYLVKWLPYSWTIVLLKLICVINIFFSFQTSLLHFQSSQQAWYYSFQHTYLLISVWKLTISLEEGWFLSGTSFLTLLRLYSISGVNHRWICWHPHIPISVNYIKPWKVHYLWESWGWMFSVTVGHIKSVICFLFQL